MLEWEKYSFRILESSPTKCTKYFFYFLFRFLLKTKKTPPPPFAPSLPYTLGGGGGSSAANPLKIWDVMPPYLKTLFEQKTEI